MVFVSSSVAVALKTVLFKLAVEMETSEAKGSQHRGKRCQSTWRSVGNLFMKISTLRIMLLITIAIAGLTSGGLSFYFIRNYQHKLYKQNFDNTALDSFESIKESLFVKLQLSIQVALGFGLACPNQSDWPNCVVSSEEFVDRTSSLVEVTQNSQFALLPIVPTEDKQAFENFAINYYQTDGGYPPYTGFTQYGPGIYALDSNFMPIPISNVTNQGHYDILVPVLQVSNISSGSTGLFYDAHSDPVMGQTLESVLDCVADSSHGLNISVGYDRKKIQTMCSSITDFIPMLNLRSSVIGTPIFAYREPHKVVGFSGAMFTWASVLAVSSRFDSTFQCIIESSTSPIKLYYSVKNGIVKETTHINDIHTSEKNFNYHLKKSFALDLRYQFSSETQYTITYYSSEDRPTQILAIVACVCCIGVTLAITIIFEIFSFLTKRETREAKTLLDSKRIFVRFISHEIRTPLNTVILGLQVLQEHLTSIKVSSMEVEKVVHECLELSDELSENASVAVTTLNDLINYDKIETKTFTIEKKLVNISSVAEKTVSLLTPQAKEKGVNILFEAQEMVGVRVYGDSVKLAQVVRNLTSNALKFTPTSGTVSVSVRFQPQNIQQTSYRSYLFSYHQHPILPESSLNPEESAGQVIIAVKDTGPGLSHEQQQILFREGVQFNPNELQGGQGSGLGLWISREIVSLHGGTISVTSEGLGTGATFEVRLPLRRTIGQEDLPSPSAVLRKLEMSKFKSPNAESSFTKQNDTDQFFSPQDRHVLVVDDAPSNRKLVSRLLKAKGFVCHEVENGLQCLEKVLSGEVHYEFIVLDFEMPVMDGPSAARQIRENHIDTLIIGVTGNVLPEDQEYFLKQGANAVLPKPVNIDELLYKVKILLGKV